MFTVSAVQFFSEAFAWFANLSAKLPKIDFKTYFIVVVALLLGVGLIVGLTYFGSYRFKLLIASKKILRYLADADSIDDDNVSDFTAQCFSSKAPSALRDCWVQYLGVRFGYPSEIVSEKAVYDDRTKRVREVRASVYIGIALLMIAVFAFWGCGTLQSADIGVILFAGLLISGAVYLALVFINRALSKLCLETFGLMQEDLDAKVDLQVEKSYATDSSPLAELAAMLDEIIARNTAKDVGFATDEGEETPLEKLIAGMPAAAENGAQNISDAENAVDTDEAESENVGENMDDVDIETEKENGGEDSQDEQSSEQTDNTEDGDSEDAQCSEQGADAQSAEEQTAETLETDTQSDEAAREQNADEAGEAIENDEPEEQPSDANSEDTAEQDDSMTADGEGNSVSSDGETVAKESDDEESRSDNQAENEEQDIAQSDKIEERPNGDVPDEEAEETEGLSEEDMPEQNPADESVSENGADDAEEEPQVKYVVEGPVDDDDIVKPAKLVKLPNLVDYMLARNPSRNILVNISKLLITTHEKFKNSPQDVAIVEKCMNKVLSALQNAR